MRRIALNSVKMNGTLVYNSGQQLTGWSFITVEQFHLQFPRNFFVYYSAAMAKIVDSVVTGSFSYASPPHRSLETSVLNYANVLIKEVIRGNQIGRAIALCRQILSLSFLPSSLDIHIYLELLYTGVSVTDNENKVHFLYLRIIAFISSKYCCEAGVPFRIACHLILPCNIDGRKDSATFHQLSYYYIVSYFFFKYEAKMQILLSNVCKRNVSRKREQNYFKERNKKSVSKTSSSRDKISPQRGSKY